MIMCAYVNWPASKVFFFPILFVILQNDEIVVKHDVLKCNQFWVTQILATLIVTRCKRGKQMHMIAIDASEKWCSKARIRSQVMKIRDKC